MVVGLDRFAASLLSRDLEAGRWGRKYRAIVEKPPCCQQSPTASAPTRCCMNSSLVQGKLIQEGKLATAPVQIASFLARSAVNANDPRDSLWAQREEQKRAQSKPPPCELVASQLGAENPVPATLRWQSVSEMHPEAKLCVTTVTLLKENAKFALYEVHPETGTSSSSSSISFPDWVSLSLRSAAPNACATRGARVSNCLRPLLQSAVAVASAAPRRHSMGRGGEDAPAGVPTGIPRPVRGAHRVAHRGAAVDALSHSRWSSRRWPLLSARDAAAPKSPMLRVK